GPGEALGRVALAPEEIRLPRTVGGDAGNLVDLGLVGDRIGGVGRRRREDEIDLVAEDELGGDLGGAAAARLAVLADDLDLVGAPAALPTLGQDPGALFEDEAVGFAEARERTGLRADVTDLDDAALGVGRDHLQHRRRRNGAEAGADERSARDAGVKIVRCVLGHMSLRCGVRSLWSLPDASRPS